MAYFIFTKNLSEGNLYKIASNDADKDALHFSPAHSIVKDVSDEDFLKIRSERSQVYLDDNDNVIIEDRSCSYTDASGLQGTIDSHIKLCNRFIEDRENENNPLLSRVTSYRDMCQSFDVSTINFPLNDTWEGYLLDNSIDFISPLQFCV